jgi:anaerobic selenocysteine-containing dehydrogenase
MTAATPAILETRHPSVCPLDCPDRCSLEVTVRDGRVAALEGSHANPLTEGFICSKVRRFPERVYGPDRLLHPLRRTGRKGEGRFERISWDEGLRLIADRLREVKGRWGGEAILPYYYGGNNGLVGQGTMDARFFARLGASRLDRAVCAAPTGAVASAMTGKMPGVAFADYVHARLILLWGANPWHSNVHLLPHIKAAREAGARVVLLDPRRTGGGAYVDSWLPVYPGGDVAVALAMIRHLDRTGRVAAAFLREHARGHETVLEAARPWTFERASEIARVPAAEIAALAEAYAEADPAVVRIGWGLERNRNGGSAVAAILALVAVAGKPGRRGGGFTMSQGGAFRVDEEHLAGRPEAPTRVLNMNLLGRMLLGEVAEPPIQALFVYDCNPVATVPHQTAIERGLAREDLFTVVFDAVMTDTARYADVVLPAVTFLEQSEVVRSYGTFVLQRIQPVIPALGEARPNEDVFRDLAARMGFEEPEFREDARALAERAVASIRGPLAGPVSLERLDAERLVPFDFPGPNPVQFVTAFPLTSDRRIHLSPPELGPNVYAYRDAMPDALHPLALISPSSDKTINSVLGELVKEEAHLTIHPDDARARAIGHGDGIRVFNGQAEVHCRARLDPRIRPGVVSLPKGYWRRSFGNGLTSTALAPDTLSEIGGGACFNDTRVEVAPLVTEPSRSVPAASRA